MPHYFRNRLLQVSTMRNNYIYAVISFHTFVKPDMLTQIVPKKDCLHRKEFNSSQECNEYMTLNLNPFKICPGPIWSKITVTIFVWWILSCIMHDPHPYFLLLWQLRAETGRFTWKQRRNLFSVLWPIEITKYPFVLIIISIKYKSIFKFMIYIIMYLYVTA